MIVVDASAIVAIVFGETEREQFLRIISKSDRAVVSAVNAHEAAIVLRAKRGLTASLMLWHLLDELSVDIVPFDAEQAQVASLAFDRFGKGINSKTRLNLADCAAYALSKTLRIPLLFKGQDFVGTDVQACAEP